MIVGELEHFAKEALADRVGEQHARRRVEREHADADPGERLAEGPDFYGSGLCVR